MHEDDETTPEQARSWIDEETAAPPLEHWVDGVVAPPAERVEGRFPSNWPAKVLWGHAPLDGEEDGFHGDFTSRDEAIADARLAYPGEDFLIAYGHHPDPAAFMPGVEWVMEQAQESASCDVGDVSDHWPDISEEAEKEFDDFLAQWARKYAPCTFWVIDGQERVTAMNGESDLEIGR